MLEDFDVSTINAHLPDASYIVQGSLSGINPGQSGTSSVATAAERKTQRNADILQATLEVSLRSKNQPLALLLKSAIAGINELLKPQFGDNAIQAAAGQDNTPDGTAGRIVSLSTGFYAAYQQQHAGEEPGAVLSQFMTTIRGGFAQGAKEAQGILQGMGVLSGDLASNIDKTLALVQQGYADFEAAQRSSLASPSATSRSPATAP